MKDKAAVFAEFTYLRSRIQNTSDEGMTPENRPKNNNKDILPYDQNRVKLTSWNGEKETDYINASYINGATKYRKYIALQGPFETTLNDFWQMIWEQKVNCIVMLTKLYEDGKGKCVQYWPKLKEFKTFRNIEVTVREEERHNGFTRRKMSLWRDGEHRNASQFHFTEWPEEGIPTSVASFVHLRNKVMDLSFGHSPLLIHCSTGVGATGTFIAFDYLMEQADTTDFIDVKQCVEILREQRMKMVQTKEQYIFLHQLVLEALLKWKVTSTQSHYSEKYQDFTIGHEYSFEQHDNSENYQSLGTDRGYFLEHDNSENYQGLGADRGYCLEHIYEDLQCSSKRTEQKTASGRLPENVNILSADSAISTLLTEPENDTEYINAAFLASNTDDTAFISTQMPLSTTITDFWKLVFEQKVSSVVMLNDVTDESCGIYWPMADRHAQFGPFSVTITETTQKSFGEVSRLVLKQHRENHIVKHYRCTIWPDSMAIPTSTLPILDLIRTVQDNKDENPIVVHCMDGATKCGVYCVIAVAMQQMETEHKMDIPQTIQRLRHARPQIINNLEQFRFCYEVMKEYRNMFGLYKNS